MRYHPRYTRNNSSVPSDVCGADPTVPWEAFAWTELTPLTLERATERTNVKEMVISELYISQWTAWDEHGWTHDLLRPESLLLHSVMESSSVRTRRRRARCCIWMKEVKGQIYSSVWQLTKSHSLSYRGPTILYEPYDETEYYWLTLYLTSAIRVLTYSQRKEFALG